MKLELPIMNHHPVFWAAFWAGMASPVALYASPAPYWAYMNNFTVAQSFAQVGASLNNALATIAHDEQLITKSADENRSVV